MATNAPKRIAELFILLARMRDGAVKHVNDRPLTPELQARLEKALAALESSLALMQAAKARYLETSQSHKETLREGSQVATAVRQEVFSKYTDKDRMVEDYGLKTRVPRQRKPKDKGTKVS